MRRISLGPRPSVSSATADSGTGRVCPGLTTSPRSASMSAVSMSLSRTRTGILRSLRLYLVASKPCTLLRTSSATVRMSRL